MKKHNLLSASIVTVLISVGACMGLTGCQQKKSDEIVLRISNCEEYIDLGDWDEDCTIELENGLVICPENSLVEDFEEWFFEEYGKKVRVEYSTYGTNEELYNQMVMGDTYDLVCPSEYMIMKMMDEDLLEPYSEDFYDKNVESNYYIKGVSPYIEAVYDELTISGESIGQYAAGYMWGTLGIVYNPEYVSDEEANHWDILLSKDYAKRVTIKDSVRDAYFAGNSIYNYDKITDDAFVNSENYSEMLTETINATDQETLNAVEEVLSRIKDNAYSFETDSGKADMVSGKVVANQQWSGDAVYTIDQAMEDGIELRYAAPVEATNLWFDGWCMIKKGISEDPDKKLAAQAFVNYVSMPENAIRNMDYIGYTSVISGGDDDSIFQYLRYNYEAEDMEEAVEYPIGYFFTSDKAMEDEYVIMTSPEQTKAQLFAQYPSQEVMDRSVVMAYFDQECNARVNHMWTNVRCFDIIQWFKEMF